MATSIRPSIRASISQSIRALYNGPSLSLGFAAGAYSLGAIGDVPASKQIGDIVTTVRATSGSIVNSAGLIEMIGPNLPRLTYDPVTLKSLGLLVEEQRTNLVLQSAVLATQGVTVTAVAHTLSFYGTGTVTLSGAATGSKVGSGAYPTRSELTFTPTAGTLTLTVTGSVTFGQLETGASASSYIPTTSAQVTRAADVPTVNTLAPWYNALDGTLVVKYMLNNPGASVTNEHLVAISDGGFNNYLAIRKQSTGIVRGQSVVSGSVQADMGAGAASAGVSIAAMSFKANSFAISKDGSAPVTDLSGAVPAVTKLDIGYLSGAGQYANGIISEILYYPRVIDVQQASA